MSIVLTVLCYLCKYTVFVEEEIGPFEEAVIASFSEGQKKRALLSPKGRRVGMKWK